MKVLLLCTRCVKQKPKSYLSHFTCQGKEPTNLSIETDTPMVVGTLYSVLLKGLYPLSRNQSECVGDIDGLFSNGPMFGVSFEEECKIIKTLKE